jgi:hypothetical protein
MTGAQHMLPGWPAIAQATKPAANPPAPRTLSRTG